MIRRAALNISLTPELTAFVSEQVASASYSNASQVGRAALRTLERQEAKPVELAQGTHSARQR